MLNKSGFNHSIFRLVFLTVITVFFLESDLTSSVKYALAQNIKNAEPFCYLQTTNGKRINLDTLCRVTSEKTPISNSQQPLTTSNTQLSLMIEKVKIIRDKTGKDKTIYIAGIIRNNGNTTQRNIEVNYQVYKRREGNLEVAESNKALVRNLFLEPGETTTFEDEISTRPTVLMINSLSSLESGLIPVNTCYGNGVEQQELCQRVNPRSIQKLN